MISYQRFGLTSNRPTKPLHPNQVKTKIFKARKQIVVSGGTLSSPLILQRSGIGRINYPIVLYITNVLQVTPKS